MRNSKSFTIDQDIDEYLTETRGEGSASDRVNELLRRAIRQERLEKLDREAAAFFSDARNAERSEARAFQKASMRTLTRD
jgi:predicted CopG family antitoxin